MEIPGIEAQPTKSASSTSTLALTENFETFLMLLTKQLQHQDPLSPMEATDFTSQLSQFAAVEQAISTNRNLEALLTLIEGQRAASAVNYLGKSVEIEGDTALLRNGQSDWRYTLFGDAADTSITVTNEAGEIVYSGPGETGTGEHTFAWNGLGNDLERQPDGLYRISVAARDAQGNEIGATTGLGGVVNAVETINGEQMLVVGDKLIPVSGVTRVMQGSPPESAAPPAESPGLLEELATQLIGTEL